MYVCHCGGLVSDRLDCASLVERIAAEPGVGYVSSVELACGDEGRATITEDLRQRRPDRVVVAACSPRDHPTTFEDVLVQAGMNPYLVQLVNVREQAAWVTPDRNEATSKAFRLVRGALARVKLHEPLEQGEVEICPDVLVVGGGPAGLAAALTLAEAGRKVTLLEKAPILGGLPVRIEDLFPRLECGPCVLEPFLAQAECRARNHEAIRILGGRGVNPVAGLPGGWSQPLSDQDRQTLEHTADTNVTFAFESLRTFDEVVLANPAYVDMLRSETYCHRTYSMGTVDPFNRANFYDGLIRIVDPTGRELVLFPCRDYARHIAERTEPWTYLKFPYLEAVGWKGFVDGIDSGIYCATPLSRLNVSDSLPTPMAQEHFERFYEAMGSTTTGSTDTGSTATGSATTGQSTAAGGSPATGTRRAPVHHRLATHWARLIELLMAAERMVELAKDPEITSRAIRNIPSGRINPRGGVGSVEAPRGTLIHHYEADERGILTRVNLIVGTTNNHAPMAMSLKRAAEQLIHRGVIVEQGLLNRIEMAFRLYDPCLSCATHALPGHMPLEVLVREPDGVVRRRLAREVD